MSKATRRPKGDSPQQPNSGNKRDVKESAKRPAKSPPDDIVDEASDESFPASDPPSWTDTTASKDGGA